MVEFIMDEREWLEEALRKQSVRNMYLGIGIAARVYYADGLRKDALWQEVERFILRCDPDASVVKLAGVIEKAISRAPNRPPLKIDSIPITQEELDEIARMETGSMRKLAFTLLCLAKYRMEESPKANYWVTYSYTTIFKLANVRAQSNLQLSLLNRLYKGGWVGMNRIVDDTNLHVNFAHPEGEVALEGEDMRNLGNLYMYHYDRDGYSPCEGCGTIIRKNSNAHKYCPDCAALRELQRER